MKSAVAMPRAPRPAGFWIRWVAFLLDQLVVAFALGLTVLAVGGAKGPLHLPLAALLVLGPFAVAFYQVLGNVHGRATPGKWALGLQIRTTSGAYLGVGRSLVRFLAQALSALPMDLGYVWAAFNRRHRAWHDYLAGTEVLRVHGPRPLAVAALCLFGLGGTLSMAGWITATSMPMFHRVSDLDRIRLAVQVLRDREIRYSLENGEYTDDPDDLAPLPDVLDPAHLWIDADEDRFEIVYGPVGPKGEFFHANREGVRLRSEGEEAVPPPNDVEQGGGAIAL